MLLGARGPQPEVFVPRALRAGVQFRGPEQVLGFLVSLTHAAHLTASNVSKNSLMIGAS